MDGGDDLAANLRNYEIQLQQVVAALADESSPDHEELQKLKVDLEEVIKLTKDLMSGSAGPALSTSANAGGSGHQATAFKAGNKVLAPWSEDGLYYEAILEEVMSDGQCNVTFCDPQLGRSKDDEGSRKRKIISEVCLVSLLKPCEGGSSSYKRPQNYKQHANGQSDDKDKPGKQLSREELKKKQQKRVQKMKDAEEEQEKIKRSWQQFNQISKKGSSKKKGLASALGKKHVSIFASPDGVDGRVGIGTCGISGRGMTAYIPNASVTTAANNNQGTALHHSSFQKKKQLAAGIVPAKK